MTPFKGNEVEELFSESLHLASRDRQDYVLNSGKSKAIRDEVLQLLEHDRQAGSFLSKPVVDTFASLAQRIGSEIAEFRLVRELGRGAMGIVYLAEDRSLDRKTAIKILNPTLTGSKKAVERFRREAQAAARLKHTSIVPIYRYGEDRGTHFIAMEFVEGEALDRQLGSLRSTVCDSEANYPNRLDHRGHQIGGTTADPQYVHRCARIACSVSQGLETAHQSGILHRDVKPSNILIDSSGSPRLTDFGIARLCDEERLTLSGDVAGTFQYMSPEQVDGSVLDRRTDVFSLGVVLYEMLTLEPPFRGPSVSALTRAIRETDPVPVRTLNPAVPRKLATICHKALEKKPIHRYPTAAHLAADLDCFLSGEPIMARPATAVRRIGKWFNRRKNLSMALVAVLLVGSLGVAGGLRLQHRWQSMASISIRPKDGSKDLTAFLRRWNGDLLRFDAAQVLGPLPIDSLVIEPGPCRFVLRDQTGAFLEFDDVLEPGSEVDKIVDFDAASRSFDDMVYIPPGQYTIRRGEQNDDVVDEQVELEGFYLDRTKVSNAQYHHFVQETGHPMPKHWLLFGYDESLADRPVVGVNLADAQAFAMWYGKRLPTAAEWEAAARSPDGRLYPWGRLEDAPQSAFPDYDALVATQNSGPQSQYENYVQRTTAVTNDSAPQEDTGLLQLLSNVLELTATVSSTDPGHIIIKGGYWSSHPQHTELRTVITYPRVGSTLTLGFRCARSQEAARTNQEE